MLELETQTWFVLAWAISSIRCMTTRTDMLSYIGKVAKFVANNTNWFEYLVLAQCPISFNTVICLIVGKLEFYDCFDTSVPNNSPVYTHGNKQKCQNLGNVLQRGVLVLQPGRCKGPGEV